MKMEECSETSEYKIQMPGNCPEESIQHSEHGESWKSRTLHSKSFFCQRIPAERAADAEASLGASENIELFAPAGYLTKIPQPPKP